MARTKDVKVAERNQRLCDDVRANGARPYVVLAREHGMDKQLVYRVLSEAELVSKSNPQQRAKVDDIKPISNVHLFVGKAIEKRFLEGILDDGNEGKIGKLAEKLRMSPQRISAIIKGVDDLTLSEQLKVAEWMKKPIGDILNEAAAKAEAACRLPPKPANTGC